MRLCEECCICVILLFIFCISPGFLVCCTFSERYRELIDAADTIVDMKNSANKVSDASFPSLIAKFRQCSLLVLTCIFRARQGLSFRPAYCK